MHGFDKLHGVSGSTFMVRRSLYMACCWTRDIALTATPSAVGFSQLPPLWRCLEKYLSMGSWENTSLNKYIAPGSAKSLGPNSVNDITIERKSGLPHM